MTGCEGLTRRATLLAAVAALAVVTAGATRAVAGDWKIIEKRAAEAQDIAGQNQGVAIPAPREILPWRRDVEQRADRALAAARATLRRGDQTSGERRLAAVARDYPATHAGRTARAELDRLRQAGRWAGAGRRALGVTGDIGMGDGDAIAISPVAGWQTVVRRGGVEDLRESLIEAAGDRVFFEEGSAKLSKAAERVLRQQALWLAAHPNVEVKIVGHADDEGTGVSNLRLSHDRAVAVRTRLMHAGISGNRLHVVSIGDAQPIAICAVRTCAAQNRRVVSEIRLKRQAFGLSR